MANAEKFKKGAEVMEKLLGNAPDSAPNDLMEVTIENLFGDIWSRDGLELRDRSMITCAALIALGKEPELRVHFRGALNVGISPKQLEEMIIHLAHYGGWPSAMAANRAFRTVLEEAENKA